jgi:hypothetical protein
MITGNVASTQLRNQTVRSFASTKVKVEQSHIGEALSE